LVSQIPGKSHYHFAEFLKLGTVYFELGPRNDLCVGGELEMVLDLGCRCRGDLQEVRKIFVAPAARTFSDVRRNRERRALQLTH
jgi:hypothetical protein